MHAEIPLINVYVAFNMSALHYLAAIDKGGQTGKTSATLKTVTKYNHVVLL